MEQYEQYSDEELICMLRSGQQEIADYLVNKYKSMVRTKARAMYLMGGDTDDLIQEGMIGLYKAIRDYRDDRDASFLTFARLCIERQLYSAIQVSNRQKHMPLNSYISLSGEEWEVELKQMWEESPESIIIDKENTDDVIKRIHDALSPFENVVLDMYLKGYDYVQIAELLDKSSKSIDNALQRIRSKVRTCMKR
ncbi:MAG: sigma-70 family RNA polymerase sigma factor [Lachnospiraceae bacterium]|nr:sigma-70 family RNA polymerase sigma factor [Lachnospiraceae bacterium]